MLVNQSLHVNMKSQHDSLFKKKTPNLTTHGKKPSNPYFKFPSSHWNTMLKSQKAIFAFIGSDDTNCLTSDLAFIDFHSCQAI